MEKEKENKPAEAAETDTKSFCCSLCRTTYKYENFGRLTEKKSNLHLLEDVFYMKDPFSNKNLLPLMLGGVCSVCNQVVCMANTCSLFYTKRFCMECIQKNITHFPTEVQKEVEKFIFWGENEYHSLFETNSRMEKMCDVKNWNG